jgi:hypothetical protein
MKRLGCVALLFAVACVGPARTDPVYEGKAVETAKAVRSAIETARLAAIAARDGKASVPYLSVILGEAEADASSAAGAFDSIQPPSDRAGALHDDLAGVIDEAVKRLRDMRVAARRSEPQALAGIGRELAGLSRRLDAFVEDNE